MNMKTEIKKIKKRNIFQLIVYRIKATFAFSIATFLISILMIIFIKEISKTGIDLQIIYFTILCTILLSIFYSIFTYFEVKKFNKKYSQFKGWNNKFYNLFGCKIFIILAYIQLFLFFFILPI